MKSLKIILLLVVAFGLGVLLYFMIKSGPKDKKTVLVKGRDSASVNANVRYYTEGVGKQSKLSMKQIDSMSANLNYKFTKENRVADSISAISNVNPKEAKLKDK